MAILKDVLCDPDPGDGQSGGSGRSSNPFIASQPVTNDLISPTALVGTARLWKNAPMTPASRDEKEPGPWGDSYRICAASHSAYPGWPLFLRFGRCFNPQATEWIVVSGWGAIQGRGGGRGTGRIGT